MHNKVLYYKQEEEPCDVQEGVGSFPQLEADDSYHSPLLGYYYQLNVGIYITFKNIQ